ncbi:hypothetical protein KC909_04530 [Candidatus Dojkabacteria bacterium]|uniref:Nucleoside 2-deoxyribosyltransferase n=1 Tax=Candidatus Dojkabacteria bacterium TaxID=2099670 RepID=A0A955RJB0_9BACT|nr:hypothetical protein [Candidatus Dojkabacteria bacterium]
MKIFFGCTSEEILKYHEYYSAIRNFLIEEGHTITRDWYPGAYEAAKHGVIDFDQRKAFSKVIQALEASQVMIVEDTISNFSTGYQITYALQHRKPILVLWTGEKNKHATMTFLHGLPSNYLQISRYDLENYKEIIREFLNKYNEAKNKHRFHLVIDQVEKSYLDFASYNEGKSKTEIIRESIRDRMNADDQYSDYLRKDKKENS